MKTGAEVSTIIPSWNRVDLLASILVNLKSQTAPPAEIIVVDNGSTDGSSELARSHGVRLIRLEVNQGFAVAVNEGIAAATTPWILILNNDVILEPDWLETLLSSAQKSNASFAVGKLLNLGNDSVIDGTWDLVSRAGYAWRCGYGRPDSAAWSARRDVAMAPMTAALFQKRMFDAVGLLETRFESYYEDVDFGIRCALAGFRGVYEPSAVARHMSKATLGPASYRVMYLSARNQFLLLAKYYCGRTVARFWWPILAGQLLAIVAAAKHGHLKAAIRGKWDGMRRWNSFRKTEALLPGRGRQEVERVFCDSENQIRRIQKEIGFDPYWKLYFFLIAML